MVALTHVPSPNLQSCELTYLHRAAIDPGLANEQHAEYCRVLRDCGVEVHVLGVNRDLPDSVFIEDTAIVLDEVAVLTSMGTESRRKEPAGIEPELRKYREVHRIKLPARIEGGDVLRVGKTLLVGISPRTNAAGAAALDSIAHPYGYTVVPVKVTGCLHLKTACTALDEKYLLVNRAWLDMRVIRGFEFVHVPEPERWGANTLSVGGRVLLPASQVRTAELVSGLGFNVLPVDVSEFTKAEGSVTCLSLLFRKAVP